MGSWVYAHRCKERGDRIAAMISLETIGYFSNAPGSQKYPMIGLRFLYPSAGNFIGFVGNVSSRALVRQALGTFRAQATLPSEGAALPASVPGIGWSDHWAFWKHGYPAIMVTDTAPFRYPHYHARSDTPDKLDYESMTRVVQGLQDVISDLAGASRNDVALRDLEPSAGSRYAPSPMRILVIEDEKKTRAFLAKGLREAGYTIDLAVDGEEGLELAQRTRFDLLIVDVMLPKKDGWEVVAELRSTGARTPILFLTARDGVRDRVKGLELGADDYLVKPFAFSELLARVAPFCGVCPNSRKSNYALRIWRSTPTGTRPSGLAWH